MVYWRNRSKARHQVREKLNSVKIDGKKMEKIPSQRQHQGHVCCMTLTPMWELNTGECRLVWENWAEGCHWQQRANLNTLIWAEINVMQMRAVHTGKPLQSGSSFKTKAFFSSAKKELLKIDTQQPENYRTANAQANMPYLCDSRHDYRSFKHIKKTPTLIFYKSNLSTRTKAPQIEQTAGSNWPPQPVGIKATHC